MNSGRVVSRYLASSFGNVCEEALSHEVGRGPWGMGIEPDVHGKGEGAEALVAEGLWSFVINLQPSGADFTLSWTVQVDGKKVDGDTHELPADSVEYCSVGGGDLEWRPIQARWLQAYNKADFLAAKQEKATRAKQRTTYLNKQRKTCAALADALVTTLERATARDWTQISTGIEIDNENVTGSFSLRCESNHTVADLQLTTPLKPKAPSTLSGSIFVKGTEHPYKSPPLTRIVAKDLVRPIVALGGTLTPDSLVLRGVPNGEEIDYVYSLSVKEFTSYCNFANKSALEVYGQERIKELAPDQDLSSKEVQDILEADWKYQSARDMYMHSERVEWVTFEQAFPNPKKMEWWIEFFTKNPGECTTG